LELAADENSAVSLLEGMQKYQGNQLSYEKGADLVVGRTEFVLKLQLTQLIEVALQQQYKQLKLML
jgi:beta-glucosidase